MFLIDFIVDWSYSCYYWLRDTPYFFIRNHLISFFFMIICFGLVIQGSLVFNIFSNPGLSTATTDTITITTPSHITLNQPFILTLSLLHINTTYQIFFLTASFFLQPQQQFLANQTFYSTFLTVNSNLFVINNTLHVAVTNFYTHSLVGLVILPIGGP